MIGYVRGTLEDIEEGNAVVDVQGLGYNVKISTSTASLMPPLHSDVKLYTYTSITENGCSLYGFLDKDELQIFKQLITVNGVGPKGAQGVLSVMSANDLRFAIIGADIKMISSAPGIGKKTAERIILDLRDKISLEDTLELALEKDIQNISNEKSSNNKKIDATAKNEAVEALVALGYGAAEALKAVNKVELDGTEDSEIILKKALKNLF